MGGRLTALKQLESAQTVPESLRRWGIGNGYISGIMYQMHQDVYGNRRDLMGYSGMAEMHVLTALYSKYAYVMGALRSSELDAEKHRADLEYIAATIKLFKPDWTGDGIKPRKAHKPNRWPSRGGGMQTALSVLRQATEPLTTREIVVRVLEHHKMPEPHYDEIKQIMTSFNGALRNRIGRGVVLVDGYPKRWAVR